MSTKGIQSIYFTCPTCQERFAQTEAFETEIHMGETYHCGECGGQVIFQALSMEQHSELRSGPVTPVRVRASGLLLRRTPVRVRTVHVDRHACYERRDLR